MKLIPTSLLGSALFFSAVVQAQTAYNSACNPLPQGEKEVKPGLFATYGCGQSLDQSGATGESKSAATPKDCALECSKRSPNGPCVWFDIGVCYFYNPGAAPSVYTNAVKVEVRKDWDRLEAAYDTCMASLSTCSSTGGPPGGSTGGPPGGSTGGPPTAPAGTIPLSAASCPSSNGARIWHGGQTWKLVCRRNPASYPTGREHSVSNRDQCIDICSSSSNCKWSHFEDASNRCYTYDGNFVDAPVPADSSWSAYIKV